MVFPWGRGRGTASDQLPCLKLRVEFLRAMPLTPSCASSAGTVHHHQDVPGTTLPVPEVGLDGPVLILGQRGGGVGGESVLDALPLSVSPLPPVRTKAGIEGQGWHFSQAPRLLRLSLALQGLSALTLPWGLWGLP